MLRAFFRDHVQNVRLKLLVTFVVFAYVAVMAVFDLPCPILRFTGIPCPGCGMTRALLSALRLEFGKAFGFHYMFWSLPALYLFFLCDGRLFKRTNINRAVMGVIAIGFMINWIRHFV